jgi:hypothetical protein
VADDLLRQITADPFLDAERRGKLQAQALCLRETAMKEVDEGLRTTLQSRSAGFSFEILRSILVGVTTSLVAGGTLYGISYLVQYYRGLGSVRQDILGLMGSIWAAVVIILGALWVIDFYRKAGSRNTNT